MPPNISTPAIAKSQTHPPNEEAIIQAFQYPATQYFITTSMFWDCDCWENFIRPADMPMCEECGAFKSECPDSRINEIRTTGIHVRWTDPSIIQTLTPHNTTDLWQNNTLA